MIRPAPLDCAFSRSDGVLNPSGVRFRSAKIYTVLDSPALKPSFSDALVVQRSTGKYSHPTKQDLLFIKFSPSVCLTTSLIDKIRDQISKDLSRRHVPRYFSEVDEIQVPFNVNGKKLETLVKKIVDGGPAVLAMLKMTDDEAKMTRKFVEFYDVEPMAQRQVGARSKL